MNKSSQQTSLAEMQSNFISDCLSAKLNKDKLLMATDIDSSVISAKGLMGIYQSSAIANITQALTLTYPVIDKLVGEVFFRATCREFIYVTWPKSGNMDDYGAEFADFLASFEHAKDLTYLKDVARLEWAFHQSSLADDADITDWASLSQVNDILQLQFTLAPAVRLLTSTFPIDKIWQLNQTSNLNNTETNINQAMDEDTYLVIARRGLKTEIVSIDSGEYALLAAIEQKLNFEQAITAATSAQPSISIDESLKKFIELTIISGFEADF